MLAKTPAMKRSSSRRSPAALPVVPHPVDATSPAVRLLLQLMEAVVLISVTLAPWAFGAAEPAFEFLLNGAVCLLLALWGLRMILEKRFTWRKCPVALCLAGLILTGMLQLIPLPHAVLSTLSPATASLYEQLLPATQEVLPAEQTRLTASPPAGSTLSLYPGASRRELLRLLAVLALFAVVRNNLASPAAFRRLSLAVVANGALLALLGLLQFFTSPSQVLYWTWVSPGHVFGPFICRTHFACWANVCVGLGIGLLLSSVRAPTTPRVGTLSWGEQMLEKLSAPLTLLQEPRVLWVAVALALLLSGVLFSLSRGGVLALLGACLAIGVIRLRHRPGASALGGALLGLVLAAGLASWFGFGAVQNRLASLWEGKAWEESRLPLWKSTLPLIQDFLWCGTGYGTFQHVEPLHRSAAANPAVVYDHAHNEYLEALVEGGMVRLALSLLAIAAVLRLGWRAVRQHEGHSAAGLALGGLFAVVTLLLHSVGDFGLHLPAIAFLAAVVCAQLCSLDKAGAAPDGSFSLGGIAPVVGGLGLLLVGLLLVGESWRLDRVERWRFAALHQSSQASVDSGNRRVAMLDEAARLAPESAVIQAELGQAHLDIWEQRLDRLQRQARIREAALLVAAAPLPLLTVLDEVLHTEEAQYARAHLTPALKHFLQARDLCPLLPRPQLRLAAHADALKQGDPASAYLERAARLAPADPELEQLRKLQNAAEDR